MHVYNVIEGYTKKVYLLFAKLNGNIRGNKSEVGES